MINMKYVGSGLPTCKEVRTNIKTSLGSGRRAALQPPSCAQVAQAGSGSGVSLDREGEKARPAKFASKKEKQNKTKINKTQKKTNKQQQKQ